jgi:hypothetical protein
MPVIPNSYPLPRFSFLPLLSLLPGLDLSFDNFVVSPGAGFFFFFLSLSSFFKRTEDTKTCRTLSMATLNRTIQTLSRLSWRMARSLLSLIHTQRHSQRPSSYADVPFPIRTFVLIPAGINRCILYFLGCHCRTVGCDRCALQLDTVLSQT